MLKQIQYRYTNYMATLYTIGHSNRTLNVFLELLKTYHITHLVDVRSIPASRQLPWFNQSNLQKVLPKHNICYSHMKDLGGFRHAKRDSTNQGWHNAAFRGFADYMQTPVFFAALKKLNHLLTKKHRVVIMCAEAVPWRCHRSLIADAEVIRGVKVVDILSETTIREHDLTPFALVDRSKRPIQLFYPASQLTLL